jgi:hypothetical protein
MTAQGCSHSNIEFVSKISATASLQMAIQQTLTLVLSHEHCAFVVFLVFGFVILIWRRRHAVAADCVPSSFFDLSLQLLCLFCVYLLFYTLQICVQESIAALWAQRSRALLQ